MRGEPQKSKAQLPLLEIEGLRTTYRSEGKVAHVVRGVSLTVEAGATVGVLGESGSGKTQTFYSILGLDQGSPGVVAGRALWKGRDLLSGLDRAVVDLGHEIRKNHRIWRRQREKNLGEIRGKEIGLLFQEPRSSLIPYWTIERLLQGVSERSGTVQASHDFSELLARLGFRDPQKILSSFPADLSGGEAQRVMIAVATILKPELIVADEPTTALDAVSQRRVLAELDAWASEGNASMVLISHDIAVLQLLAKTLYVFFRGRVVEQVSLARLDEASTGELHPYTERLKSSQIDRAAGARLKPELADSLHPPHDPDSVSEGCPYAPFCPLRSKLAQSDQKKCWGESPPQEPVTAGQFSACWGLNQ